MSRWSGSIAKRVFDIAVVLALAPLATALAAAVAAALYFTSDEPVLFRQTRVGRGGRPFVILKFRTMRGSPICSGMTPERITGLGRFLRWSKLDELPQLLHVLRGEMSLVGPRPKIREQSMFVFACRPGLTGAATLLFVQERSLLERIPQDKVTEYYERVLLPLKCQVDEAYMMRATFLSDLRILADTAMNLWRTANVAQPGAETGWDSRLGERSEYISTPGTALPLTSLFIEDFGGECHGANPT
jgi:lipopolysaccharide/colanic/teichoic acid biosynthesis glycosyltransferase